MRYYQDRMLEVFTTIISAPKPLLLHCRSGKDRTGIIVAILQFLEGFDPYEIIQDYLLSRENISEKKIRVVLSVLYEFGGAEGYLQYIGVNQEQIEELKNNVGV